jgi:GNAT superfamily N-acetyltransferase
VTSGPGIQIRTATVEDLPGIRDCLRTAFARYRAEYTAPAFADTVLTPESARARLRSMAVLVALDGSGAVVGTVAWASVSPDEAHLRGMAVVPSLQGRGVADALLLRALGQIQAAGHRRVTLDTTLPLTPARRFYEKNGFRPLGKVSDFFGMPLVEYYRTLRAAPTPVGNADGGATRS